MPDTSRLTVEGLARAADYSAAMEEALLPAIAARCTEETVPGSGDKPLHVYRYDAERPRGTAMILHGFTDSIPKYSELIHSLLVNDWSVLAYDQRCHGRSWRPEWLEKEDPSLTHVDRFEDYLEDMERVVESRLRGMPRPWVVIAHSMGGAVTALFLERHADVFARAVLCAPMIAPHRGGMPLSLIMLICRVNQLLGRGRKRAFVSRPYSGPEDFATSCAACRARFAWYDAVKASDPQLQNNGPSYTWVAEAMQVTRKLLAPGAVERIRTPLRVYTAESDMQVLPEAQELFAGRLKDGERILVAGSRHEIFRSEDDVFFPWWRGVLAFLDEARTA